MYFLSEKYSFKTIMNYFLNK